MKIALVQMNSTIGDFEGNARAIVRHVAQALEEAGGKLDLVVFPELSLCGYPPMDLLDQRTFVEGTMSALRLLQRSLPPDLAVAAGYVDENRSGSGRGLVNAFSVIHRGRVIFTQTKTLLPTYDVFDEARYFEPAAERKTFELGGKRIGFAICEDFWWESPPSPSFRYPVDPVSELLDGGMDILLVPSASPFVAGKLDTRLKLAESTTRRGRIPVLYCNASGANDSLVFDGRSFVMNPEGRLCGICGWDEETLFYDSETHSVWTRDGKPAPTCAEGKSAEEHHRAIVTGIGDYMRKSGFSKACLGLSGGIDSALVAVLAAEALGADKLTCIAMPSRFSSPGSLNDSVELCARLGIRLERLSIEGPFSAFLDVLAAPFAGKPWDLAEENLQARIRGCLLMAWSNKFGSLLLTTGNKSEIAAGYCTLYGDMCGALAPIGDLYKTEVYSLAEHLNARAESRGEPAPIPRPILEKAPSAELRHDQKDQDSLPEYALLDAILKEYIEENSTFGEIVSKGFDPEVTRKVLDMTAKAEYKRRQAAPVVKVSKRAFGVGRRLPLARRVYETER
ncbi:MAG TPA: NAD+ synthase [Rectinemataceae bacterium]